MSLDQVVTIALSANTKTPTQKGFGTPIIMAYHTLDAVQRVRTYTSLTAMVTDGFGLRSGAYLAALAMKSQSPSPTTWKIGRRAAAYAQQIEVDVTTAVAGEPRGFTLTTPGGTSVVITTTVGATATAGDVATSLATLVSGVTGGTGPTSATGPAGCTGYTGVNGVVAAVTGTTGVLITTTGTAAAYTPGLLANVGTLTTGLSIANKTLDSGIAADILACQAEDDDWYGVILDSNGKAEVAAAAAQIEAMLALLVVDSADTDNGQASGTASTFAALYANSYARTVGVFNSTSVQSGMAAATLGGRLPDTPGSSTWAHKNYSGVTVDRIGATAEGVLEGRKANYYTYLGGQGNFFWGTTFAGQFVDITIFCDWLRVRMQERLVGLLQGAKKVPLNDNGIAKVVNEIYAQLNEGVRAGGLNADSIVVTAPKASEISTANKALRTLPDIEFSATLSGAIHKIIPITGVVSL